MSEPRPLPSTRSDHAVGWWLDGERAVLELGDGECAALDSDLEVRARLSLPYGCDDVVDLGSRAPLMVAFKMVAVGLGADGEELWRFTPSDSPSLKAAALFDEQGLYGIAFGPGGDEGIVAVDLKGRPLWDVPKVHVLYELSTHSDLPGKILEVGWGWNWYDHDRSGVEVPGLARAARSASRRASYLYPHSGILFPDGRKDPAAIIAGTYRRDAPVVARVNEDDEEIWRASLSARPEGLCLLGRREEVHVFAVALGDRTVVVFDEHGTLLDEVGIPSDDNESRYFVFAFDGGPIGSERWAITIDTNHGDFLIGVDLRPR